MPIISHSYDNYWAIICDSCGARQLDICAMPSRFVINRLSGWYMSDRLVLCYRCLIVTTPGNAVRDRNIPELIWLMELIEWL